MLGRIAFALADAALGGLGPLSTSPLAALLDIRRNRALVEGSAKDADDLALREILIEKFI